MSQTIARLAALLLRLLLPARGRHRSAGSLPAWRCEAAGTLLLPPLPGGRTGPLRGENAAVIRPYVLAPEERQERQERRLQYGRRRALWLVVQGVDAGPRWIPGVEVAG